MVHAAINRQPPRTPLQVGITRHGYWLAVVFLVTVDLVTVDVKNFYTFIPQIYTVITSPHPELTYSDLTHRASSVMVVDFVVTGVVIALLLVLILKFALGKRERAFLSE